MSTHIGAKQGDIAERILLPGDPLRAKFVAENFLENARCYNEVLSRFMSTSFFVTTAFKKQSESVRQARSKKIFRCGRLLSV